MIALLADIQFEVKDKEEQWLKALQAQDAGAVSELLHDEFTSTSARSTGEVLRKREYIATVPQLKVCEYQLKNVSVYNVGSVVVVKARLICDSKFGNLDLHDDLLITDVWLKIDDRWMAITRHASRTPNEQRV